MISNLTYESFLDEYFSVKYATNKENEDSDSILDDEISDPKLKLQKELIKSMFLKSHEESEEDSKKLDRVNLSDLGKKLSNALQKLELEENVEEITITYEKLEYQSIEVTQQGNVEEAEPLILDLNGNGLELSDVRDGDGVKFDITGDGVQEKVSWAKANDGFLVYDRNKNNVIDSGKELFGDQHGAKNGFEELAKFDSDSNGTINDDDEIYSELKVWQDRNQNGYSEESELSSLKDLKISEISLNHDNTRERIAGNRVEGYSTYTHDSVEKAVGEVFLNYLV